MSKKNKATKPPTQRYWISWYQAGDDYRPLSWPPPPHFIGYWCSGYSDDSATLCLWIEQTSEAAAWADVEQHWSPGVGKRRFSNVCEPDFVPGDRFPRCEWSTLDERKPS